MADYSLRFKSGKWHARYRDAHGKRAERVTPFGRDEKRKAQDYANELAIQASRVRQGLDRAQVRLTLGELWDKFEPIAKRKRSWASIRGRWENHLKKALGAKQIDSIEPADIEELMARKQEEGLSPQTVEHLRVLLSSMFSYAIKKLRVLKRENPARIAARPKIPPARIRFLDPVSLERLLAAVPKKWSGIFAVSAYTGLRKGEVLGLQLNDVDLGRSLLWVFRSYDRNTTKGGKGRVVGFPPGLEPHLRAAMVRAVDLESEWVFPGKEGDVRGPDTKLTNVLRKALRVAGVTAPPGFSYKDLRSTFATHLAEVTGDLRVVQKQLGHSSPAITDKHYAFARDRHLVSQVARLPFGNPAPELADAAHRLPPNIADPDQTQPSPTEPS